MAISLCQKLGAVPGRDRNSFASDRSGGLSPLLTQAATPRALVFGLVLFLGLASGAIAQSGRHHRSAEDSPKESGPAAVFTGTVTSLTKSDLGLQAEGGNTLNFSLVHKTHFLKDGKAAKRTDVHPGDTVTIQAGEDPDGHPEALTVTIGKPAEKTPQPSN